MGGKYKRKGRSANQHTKTHIMTTDQMYKYAATILRADSKDKKADVIERYLEYSKKMWQKVKESCELSDCFGPCEWIWCKDKKVYIFH